MLRQEEISCFIGFSVCEGQIGSIQELAKLSAGLVQVTWIHTKGEQWWGCVSISVTLTLYIVFKVFKRNSSQDPCQQSLKSAKGTVPKTQLNLWSLQMEQLPKANSSIYMPNQGCKWKCSDWRRPATWQARREMAPKQETYTNSTQRARLMI